VSLTRSERSTWQWGLTACALLIGADCAGARGGASDIRAGKSGFRCSLPKDAEALRQFEAQYRAAHSPRILLFWNVSFDDETHSTEAAVEVTETTLPEKGGNSDTPAQVHASFNTALDPAKQHPRIAPRERSDVGIRFPSELA